MKKNTRLAIALLSMFVIGAATALAQDIQPSGKIVGCDKQGNAIYRVSANGVEIAYRLVGSGEPLTMIMGLAGTMDHWDPEVIAALSKKYQLIMLDNRGMGHSTVNNVSFTAKLFADDVIGLLDALKIKKTNVLGFSMGSIITQELLLEYPERFNKAIIYATCTDGNAVITALKGKIPDDPIVLRQTDAISHWKTPIERLSLIPNQVMVLVGTADDVVGIESSKTLAAAIPGAWLVQFKNGTHFLIHEAPAEFVRVIVTFLDIDETVPN